MVETTFFYRTSFPVAQEHIDEFTACHQEHYPGNQLSILTNVDSTECVIKCCGNMNFPAGFICTGTYTREEVQALLLTPEWHRDLI